KILKKGGYQGKDYLEQRRVGYSSLRTCRPGSPTFDRGSRYSMLYALLFTPCSASIIAGSCSPFPLLYDPPVRLMSVSRPTVRSPTPSRREIPWKHHNALIYNTGELDRSAIVHIVTPGREDGKPGAFLD